MTISEVYERINYLLSITNKSIEKPETGDLLGFNKQDYLFFKDIDLDSDIIPDSLYKLQNYKNQLIDKNLWTDVLEKAIKPKYPAFKKRIPRPISDCEMIQFGSQVEFSNMIGFAWDFIYALKAIGAKPKQTYEGYNWIVDVNRLKENQASFERLGIDLSKLVSSKKAITPEVKVSGELIISKARKRLHFHFKYNPELVSFFKANLEFTYNKKDFSRSINPTTENSLLIKSLIDKAKSLGLKIVGGENINDLDEKINDYNLDLKRLSEIREVADSVKVDFEVEVPGLDKLKKVPFGYQKAGIAFLNMTKGRAILGDEMGLGKTFQAISWVVTNNKRAIVICPKSFIYGWKDEIEKFSHATVQVLTSNTNIKKEPLNGSIFTVINYESAGKFKFKDYDTIIIDESHLIKNKTTARYKNVKKIAAKASHVLCLSGTAILNRPVELFTQLNLIKPSLSGTYEAYTQKYCGAFHDGYRWNVTGASNLSELVKLIAPVYIRRNKKDVLKDLPSKIRQEIVVQGIKIEDPVDRSYEGMLSWITKAKVNLAKKKTEATIEFAKNLVEQGDKVIIFSDYIEPITQIAKAFGDQAVCYLASLNPEERAAAQKRFQEDPKIKVFAATSKIASVALTLTAASRVIFNDLPWTPGGLMQAEDRAHRIGQMNMVNVYRMVARGTLDDHVTEILTAKAEVLKTVLEGRQGDFTKEQGENAEKTILTDIIDYFRVNKFKTN